MKNIIKYSKSGILIALLASIGGCSDFSELQSYGPPTSDQFWKTEADVQNAVNGLYMYSTYEECAGRGHYWYECCNDIMIDGRNNSDAAVISNFMMTPLDQSRTGSIWGYMYQEIGRANSILLYAPDMNIPEATRNYALGQAYFFRGYSYLWLAPWYGDNRSGGIPIIREDTPVDGIDLPRPASVLENYDMIIDDLRKAADLLPSWADQAPSDYGRPHKAAAWAFAARAALYASQWDNKYLDIVIEMCDYVINQTGGSKRELHPNYRSLFRAENNFSSEYIFSMLGNATSGPKYHGMSGPNNAWGYNTWGYFQPTAELYEMYENDDQRRAATILAPGDHITFMGKDIHVGVAPADISSPSKLLCGKFLSIFEDEDCKGKTVNSNGDNASNVLGTVVMRYADVLLMKAEALIWKNGEGDGTAKTLLNLIRKRAGLFENSNATKAELKKERCLELAFEFLPSRHIDMVRWGDAQTAYAQKKHGYKVNFTGDNVFVNSEKVEVWTSRTFDPAKHQVFPIPQKVIESAKNLKQNIGY
jgi:hypothetical protein